VCCKASILIDNCIIVIAAAAVVVVVVVVVVGRVTTGNSHFWYLKLQTVCYMEL